MEVCGISADLWTRDPTQGGTDPGAEASATDCGVTQVDGVCRDAFQPGQGCADRDGLTGAYLGGNHTQGAFVDTPADPGRLLRLAGNNHLLGGYAAAAWAGCGAGDVNGANGVGGVREYDGVLHWWFAQRGRRGVRDVQHRAARVERGEVQRHIGAEFGCNPDRFAAYSQKITGSS